MTLQSFVAPHVRKVLTDLGVAPSHPLPIEIPKQEGQGHLSTTVAMSLAKELKKAPKAIAEEIIANLGTVDGVAHIDVAGPGFINFTFKEEVFHAILASLNDLQENIGRSQIGAGRTVNVEYVSANPTGPLHAGHGRNCALGDTVASLMDWTGHTVTREYYFNNAGNQMNKLAESVRTRVVQALGTDREFPEDGYHGEYIKDVAQMIVDERGKEFLELSDEEQLQASRAKGEVWCFESIKATLGLLNIKHDVYFNESQLFDDGKIARVVDDLKERGLTYEKDGATWFALEKLGMPQDKVIIKSTGEPTYRLPDIAYHRDKIEQGYDELVDIFGADHIATIPDVVAGMKALGIDEKRVKTVIHQMVTFIEDGEVVKFSKRSGKSFNLDELIEEVGADVVRFFFIMRAPGTHLDFDLDLAKEEGDKNPVFYLQYAHARISSILRKGAEQGVHLNTGTDVSCLVDPTEIALIGLLSRFQSVLERACEQLEPHQVTDYLRELAAAYHQFYHACRILGTEEPLQSARLLLADVTRRAMKNGLAVLGVAAPEQM